MQRPVRVPRLVRAASERNDAGTIRMAVSRTAAIAWLRVVVIRTMRGPIATNRRRVPRVRLRPCHRALTWSSQAASTRAGDYRPLQPAAANTDSAYRGGAARALTILTAQESSGVGSAVQLSCGL